MVGTAQSQTGTPGYTRLRLGINLAHPADCRAGSGDDYSPNIEFWLHLLASNLRFRRWIYVDFDIVIFLKSIFVKSSTEQNFYSVFLFQVVILYFIF